MADYNLSVQIEAIDKASGILQGVSNSLKGLSKETGNLSDKFLKRSGNINKFASEYGASLRNMSDASKEILGKITGWFDEGAQSISDYAYMQERLAILTKNSTGASKEETQALIKQAEAIESVGVASKEAIVAAQSQLATFDMSVDAIKELTPALVDYVVAEKGATASMDEYKSMANGLAQALNGNFATLTRAGFVLDEETKAMISNGSEMERVTAIAKVLDSTYKDFNETIAETATGKGIMLDRQLGNIKEQIAKNLIPVVDSLKEKLLGFLTFINKFAEEHPKLTKGVILTTTAVLGLGAGIGTILQLAPMLGTVLKGVGNIVNFVAGNFGKLTSVLSTVAKFLVANPRVAIATAAVTAAVLIYENWDKVKEFVLGVFDAISEKVQAVKDWIVEKFEALPEPIQKVLTAIYTAWKYTFGLAFTIVQELVSYFKGETTEMSEAWEGLKTKAIEVRSNISGTVSQFIETIKVKRDELSAKWGEIRDGIVAKVQPIFESITERRKEHQDVVTAVWETIKSTIGAILDWFRNDFSFIFDSVISIVKGAGSIVIDTFTYAFKQIGNIIDLFVAVFKGDRDGALSAVKNMFSDFTEWIGNTFNTIYETVKEVFGSAFDWVKGKIDIVLGRIDNIKQARRSVLSLFGKDTGEAVERASSTTVSAINSKIRSLQASQISGERAEGGPVSSGSTYLVGEKGPELFVPKTSGEIVPNEDLNKGGGDIHISINGTTVNNQSDIDSLVDTLIRRIKLERNFGIA